MKVENLMSSVIQPISFVLCCVFMGSIIAFDELSLKSLAIMSLIMAPLITLSYFTNKGFSKLSDRGKAIVFGFKRSLFTLLFAFYGCLLTYFWLNKEKHGHIWWLVALIIAEHSIRLFMTAYKKSRIS